jgi:ComF family protein
VPLYPARELARGYNQALLLAEPLAEAWGLPVLSNDSLWRVRDTRSQVGLNAQERQANVHDAFQASEKQVAGLNVLLLDDVRTTGATLEACSAALMDADARAVYVLTLAQAV